MNIKKAIQIYLDWKQSHTSYAFNRYRVRLEQFLNFMTPNMCLHDITGDDIVAYHNAMSKNYSPATIAYSARILKNFFSFWHGRREVSFNPKEIIPIRYVNADKDIVTLEDFEDMNELLNAHFFSELQKKLVLNILWDTGMRVSELCELSLSNLNPQGSNGLRTAKVRTRKSMRYNLVVWGADTNGLLNSYLGIRLSMDIPSDALLVNKKTGKPFTTRTIQRWIQELSTMANLDKNISPHSFRHGKANYILDKGGSVRDVSAILRHVKPESSFNYLRLSTVRYEQVAEKYLTTA